MQSAPSSSAAIRIARRPLQQPGIERFEVKEQDHPIETVQREEVASFLLEQDEAESIQQGEQIIPENIRKAALEIVRLSFKKDNKWVFSDGSGGTFPAAIKDDEFWDKVTRREFRFGKGDTLKVSLQTTTFHVQGKLRTEYTIIQVLGVITPEQLNLFQSGSS